MNSTPDIDDTAALIDKRISKYAELGYSREQTLKQLLIARFSIAHLQSRFPEFPQSAFVIADLPQSKRAALIPSRGLSPRGREGLPASSLSPLLNKTTLVKMPAPAAPMVVQQPAPATEGISFQYVPLIQCSFPHADPGEITSFTRRNGWLELTLGTTRPETGLPYGVPARLLTIYCASEAMRTRSPEIYLGKSVQDFLRLLEIPITRGARGSLSVYASQLLRLIHSTLTIDEDIQDLNGRTGLHIRQALFVDEARLWWDEPRQGSNGSSQKIIGSGSSLVLSKVLFDSILERSAPLATAAIKQLRKSPMDLDVYAWLVHRLFNLSKPSMVTWTQLSGQFGHSYGEQRMFRRFFSDSLKRVLAVYPEAKLNVTANGVLLLPSKPHVARLTTPSKPSR